MAQRSHAGRRVMNQDAVLTVRLPHGSYLLAVADGMGGHPAGDVASAEAVAALLRCVRAGSSLTRAVVHANSAVFAAGTKLAGQRGMGTTLVAALAGRDEYGVVNVGDSRAYVLDPRRAKQITTDHSLVAEGARTSPDGSQLGARWQHAVLRAVGTEPSVDVDTFGPYPWPARGLLLLCSDGLYRVIDDAELHRIVMRSATASHAADALVERALALGADDNVSVAVLDAGLLEVATGRAAKPTPPRVHASPVTPRHITPAGHGRHERTVRRRRLWLHDAGRRWFALGTLAVLVLLAVAFWLARSP